MKKILEIILVNPEMEEKRMRGIIFGFNKKSNRTQLTMLMVQAVDEYLKTDTEEGAFLAALILSTAECLKMDHPDIAAIVRKSVIEFHKRKNNNDDNGNGK